MATKRSEILVDPAVMNSWPLYQQARNDSWDGLDLSCLTAREHQAFAHYVSGVPGHEAAEFMGVSRRTYRTHVDRAKAKLRDVFRERFNERYGPRDGTGEPRRPAGGDRDHHGDGG